MTQSRQPASIERRASLVSAAVTGQIDVRQIANQPPAPLHWMCCKLLESEKLRQQALNTQALNSPVVQSGMKDILLNHSHLWEALRARMQTPPVR